MVSLLEIQDNILSIPLEDRWSYVSLHRTMSRQLYHGAMVSLLDIQDNILSIPLEDISGRLLKNQELMERSPTSSVPVSHLAGRVGQLSCEWPPQRCQTGGRTLGTPQQPSQSGLCHPKQYIYININIQTTEGRKEMFYLTMHSTHFIYGYIRVDSY